jgi:transmembrane 9 superfamily protein 3
MNVFMVAFVLVQERDLGDEYGWKQVHGDVFRPASHATLFSALVGAGYQVTVVVLSVIIFAILGELYTEWVYIYCSNFLIYMWCWLIISFVSSGSWITLNILVLGRQFSASVIFRIAIAAGNWFLCHVRF